MRAKTAFRFLIPVLLLAGAFAHAAKQDRFTDRTDVVVIEIPVQVVRDGEPVRGLTAADFEVSEGRKKQPIVGFEVLDLYSAEAALGGASPVPAAGRRHFLMLFDLTFSEPKAIAKAQEAAQDLLTSLHASDLVAVATYSSANGPQLILGFSSDRRQIETAIRTLGAPQLVDRAPDPLRIVLTDVRSDASQQNIPGISVSEGRAASQEAVLDTLERISDASARANRGDQQRVITSMTRSLSDLATLMGGVEGRKYVVYLSEGFDTSLVTGTTDQASQRELNEQSLDGTAVLEDNSDERFGSTKTLNDVEKMLEALRRADCTVQAVDIGGLKADADQGFQRRGGRDSLLQIASGTGGELYENTNDLSGAMDKMLKRTGVTYVLAVQPESLKLDGAYHKLKVELKNAPRGTRVVHRPGFYAPKPYAEQSPLEKLLATANQVTSGHESGSLDASVLAAPFRSAGAKAYVPVLLEVDGASLLAGKQGTSLAVEVYIYALDQGGAVHDFVTQTFGVDLAKAEALLRQNGFKFFGHVDLLPGEYSLRVLVRNGTTGASATRVVEVSVPQFTAQSPVLLPPFFPEPPNRWVLVREAQEPGEKEVPYPFMQRDQPYIPAARPVLGNQEVAVSLVGYHLAAGEPSVQTKVVAADGKEVGPGVLKLGPRESGGAAGPDRFAATYRPPSLPPGEYVLQVTLTDAGGAAQTSFVPFAVGATRG